MSTMYRLALVLLLLGAATPTPAAVVEVRLENFRFIPNDVTIQAGDTVRWTNTEGSHNVRADNLSFENPEGVAVGWTFERTFTQAGVVLVHCSEHSVPGQDINTSMNGRINVAPPMPPNANAGPDQTAEVLTLVTLNGSGSDPDGGPDPLTFSWAFAERPSGSTATLTNATTALASFTPDVIGLYRLMLTVSDGALSASDDVDINVTPAPADLALSLTDTPDPLTVNGQLTYTITVTNNGPGTATGVRVEDLLPGATVLKGFASSSQGECNGTETVVCDLGTLAAGAQATVTINVIPMVTGDLSNAAHVTAVETDPNPANNSSTETTTVREVDPAITDLEITAVADVGPTASGQGFTYTLTVRNNGPATATGVQLTNDLPRGIALGPVTASQAQANCSDTDPMLCDLGVLPSDATATVTIDVIRTEVETLPNRAAVNGDQFDPNSGNNFALTSALDLPTPRTACNSKRCKLKLTCNLSDLLGRTCDNQITLFVDTRARQDTRARLLSDERAVRPPKLVRFAAAIRNVPGGETTNVPLKLTSKGRKVASTLVQQGRKKLRGEMRITNAAGGIDIIRLRVRLR